MACKPYAVRTVMALDPIEIDFQLGAHASIYATTHDVTLGELIECALVHFMRTKEIPVPIKICATHGVVMECNSSGTQNAVCPVNEGSEGFKV